jgi:mono/diheme cytochrome c family protein
MMGHVGRADILPAELPGMGRTMNSRHCALVVPLLLAATLWGGRLLAETPASPAGPWDAPPEAKLLQNPLKNDGHTVERGRGLYQQRCLPCHGEKGTGDGKMALKLGYKPANLTLERLNSQVDGELFWKISKGKSPMPDFEKLLSARERWDIVSYVRTLLKTNP